MRKLIGLSLIAATTLAAPLKEVAAPPVQPISFPRVCQAEELNGGYLMRNQKAGFDVFVLKNGNNVPEIRIGTWDGTDELYGFNKENLFARAALDIRKTRFYADVRKAVPIAIAALPPNESNVAVYLLAEELSLKSLLRGTRDCLTDEQYSATGLR